MSSGNSGALSRRTALAQLGGALAVSACSQAAFLAANLPASFGAYRRRANLPYGSHPAQRLDAYLPDKPAGAAPPVVLFWHGGRWSYGDKSEYRFVGAAMTELGYVAVLPNYRHYPKVLMAGFMQDAAAAVRWAVQHARELGADPERLYLMGHSAGAHLAALVSLDARYLAAGGVTPPPIAGLIGLSGPYDFLPLQEPDVRAMFGPPAQFPESQPINFVHPGAPRMLLIHGTRDDTVWPKNSRNLASAASALKVPATLKLYPKLDHADTVAALSAPARGRAPTLADIASFVNEA